MLVYNIFIQIANKNIGSGSLELADNTQITEVASSSDGNDSCSSQSSSELTSGSSKNGENEATGCDSSDTDGSISPFRQCKRCDKAGMLKWTWSSL